MMDAAELARFIGRRGMWREGRIRVAVTVTNVRFAYGQLRYEIQPLEGEGRTFVAAESVDLYEEA